MGSPRNPPPHPPTPESKPNPILNLNLTLPMTPLTGGFFPSTKLMNLIEIDFLTKITHIDDGGLYSYT